MSWLKLHTDARNDPKLECLPDDQFRVWFRLLCFAGDQPQRGVIEWRNEKIFAVQVAHGDLLLLRATLAALTDLEILDVSGDAVQFIHWAKRQQAKPSDEPERVRERVTQFRERQRNASTASNKEDVTPGNAPVTPRNANVTAFVTQIDREIDREITTTPIGNLENEPQAATAVAEEEKPSRAQPKTKPALNTQAAKTAFQEFWDAYPRRDGVRVGRQHAEIEFARLAPEDWPAVIQGAKRYAETCDPKKANSRIPKDAERFLRDAIWHDMAEVEGQTARRVDDGTQATKDYAAWILSHPVSKPGDMSRARNGTTAEPP